MSKTSVVITTYNDADYLKRSIPSVINQSLKPLEIIIIDDGSRDNTAEVIVNGFQSLTDISIVFKKKENGGPSSARNAGIKLAKGEFVLFLDADDELLEDSLEWRLKVLESLGEGYASVYCGSIHSLNDESKFTEYVVEIDGAIDGHLLGRKNGIPGGPPYHLFRRDVLSKVNGYNESLKFNEDFELILRISKEWMFYGVNKVGFIRHIRKDSWSKSDPYIAYIGIEDFLSVAENEELLPMVEINQRRKENRLSLVKKLLVQRKIWSEVTLYIDEAFHIKRPTNIKEIILYSLNSVFKAIRWLKMSNK